MSTITTAPETFANDTNEPVSETWHTLVYQALAAMGGQAPLRALYGALAKHPKTQGRANWQAKVRQTIQASDKFVRIGPGVWALSQLHSADEIAAFDTKRRERYTRQSASDT